jgi:hypothetical protein
MMLGAKWNFPPRQGKAAFRFGVLFHELFPEPIRQGKELRVVNETRTASGTAMVSLPLAIEQLTAVAKKHLKEEFGL